MHVVIWSGLEHHIEACLINLDRLSLEWNKAKSINLTINDWVDIDSTELDVNFICSWHLLEDREPNINCIEMHWLKSEFVQQILLLNVEIDRFIVQGEVACQWNSRLQDVFRWGGVQDEANVTSLWLDL